jgi:hypothetical protein
MREAIDIGHLCRELERNRFQKPTFGEAIRLDH